MKLKVKVDGKGFSDSDGHVVDLSAKDRQPDDPAESGSVKAALRLTTEADSGLEPGKTYFVEFTEAPEETETAPVQAETPPPAAS